MVCVGVGMRLARYGESGNKTFVCEIVPNSPAEESRQIYLNDVVTHVDGQGEGGRQGREGGGVERSIRGMARGLGRGRGGGGVAKEGRSSFLTVSHVSSSCV